MKTRAELNTFSSARKKREDGAGWRYALGKARDSTLELIPLTTGEEPKHKVHKACPEMKAPYS